MQSLKKLLVISRPVSWLNTAYPFAAGYLFSGGGVDAILVIGTIYFLGPYNLLMYGINDVFDYESDIRNPRKGGIEGAITEREFHPIILWSALFVNLPFIAVLLLLGSALSAAVLATILFFVVGYSIVAVRFKERPFLDSVSSSIHFVGPLVFALSITGLSLAHAPFILAFFLWGMASHAFGAVQDIIPDRKARLSSIATSLGARVTVTFAFLLYVVSCVIIATQGPIPLLVAIAGSVYVLNVIPYLNVTDTTSEQTRPGWGRFIWLNYFVGFVVTIALIFATF